MHTGEVVFMHRHTVSRVDEKYIFFSFLVRVITFRFAHTKKKFGYKTALGAFV